MVSHLLTALITFAITNIDDLLILSVYFATNQFKTRQIVIGQFAGIAVLIVISLTALFIGLILNERYLSLLGLFPILLGIKGLVNLKQQDDEADRLQSRSRIGFVSVALVTIANGGDNIGVYAPLFANTDRSVIPVYILSFLFLTGLWCLGGYLLVSHPKVKETFSRWGRLALPVFLIALGIYICKDFFI
ncbi:cadmium resistance transporter [Chryseosolibacter indicus]|uniref:Cadmium resistance transporter n=1 Tax=Chryseosolibacter indicus TaxID=2782351 RepID=A0ABS5VZB8_9BACT|nr:cadmium resistance transporter [Chryseosolibacter indicus]MBT1705376.1 cadmium resistance transporter [Chryseosolibacter indicus]